MAVSNFCYKSHPIVYEVVHDGCLKTSGINHTRLLSANSELDTAQSATQPPADQASPKTDDLDI